VIQEFLGLPGSISQFKLAKLLLKFNNFLSSASADKILLSKKMIFF